MESPRNTWLWALAGPALVGACIGAGAGVGAALFYAAALPLVAVGTFALTGPALYIASAFVGSAPPAHEVARGVQGSLRDAGLALVGLSPALLFLSVTTSGARAALSLGVLVFGVGGFVGLRRVLARVFPNNALAMIPVFVPWAVVTAGIGLHLTFRVVG